MFWHTCRFIITDFYILELYKCNKNDIHITQTLNSLYLTFSQPASWISEYFLNRIEGVHKLAILLAAFMFQLIYVPKQLIKKLHLNRSM